MYDDERDFVDEVIEESTAKHASFPRLMEQARRNRELLAPSPTARQTGRSAGERRSPARRPQTATCAGGRLNLLESGARAPQPSSSGRGRGLIAAAGSSPTGTGSRRPDDMYIGVGSPARARHRGQLRITR
jgi:hypothetical protein